MPFLFVLERVKSKPSEHGKSRLFFLYFLGEREWSEWMKDVIAHEIMLFIKLRPSNGVNNNAIPA